LDASVLPRNMLATTPINKWQLITIPYTTMQLSVLQRNALGQKDGCALIIVAKECSWTKRRMCTHQCYKGMLLDKKTDVHSSVLQRNALGQKDGCALISVTKECSWTNRRMCTHQCYKRMLLDKKTDVHLHVSTRICTHIHQRFEAWSGHRYWYVRAPLGSMICSGLLQQHYALPYTHTHTHTQTLTHTQHTPTQTTPFHLQWT